MTSTRESERSHEIVVVSAADDGYSIPLAVTIRSALDQLGQHRQMRLFILDGGISDENKSRLLESWQDPRLTVTWLPADIDRIRDLPVSDHVNAATYMRLLMPALLPDDVSRAIYLDADMLVRRDLGHLWDEPQDGLPLLAVQDLAAPYFDSAEALATFQRCRQHLAAHVPVANYRELGLPGDAKYFNGGLLVVDLDQWRRDRISDKMLDCLRQHRRHVLWWDQYALNVVLAGKWRALDPLWNQGAHLFTYSTWQESPFDRETFQRLRTSPWVIHFCSPSKPWHYLCRHPFTRDFQRCLQQTEWSGWRPARPDNFVKLLWDFHYQPLRKEWKTRVRKLKHRVRDRLRKAAA